MRKVIYMFLILSLLCFGKNEVTINYKENEPLLGNGFYLSFGEIPIATYENTVGYFSTVEILGKNLEIKEDLKKIVIKAKGNVLKEKEIEWVQKEFEIEEIDLNGIIISLKWDNLKKDRIGLMLKRWDLNKNYYEIEIEYHYNGQIETMKLNINMPQFNPEIYLDIDSNVPILKKQEFNKNKLILKKIKLNDYDMKITENLESPEGLKVKLNSELSIGNREYLGVIKLTPLIEKYPGVYLIENNKEDIFKNSKEIVIGIELPENLNYNTNYKIFGNLLELSYGQHKKELLEKIVILDGRKHIKRVIVLENIENNQKVYLDDIENGYFLLEKNGNMIGDYKNLKIIINNEETLINENGNSDMIDISFGKIQIENGKIILFLENKLHINQGNNLKFKILSLKDEVLEDIELEIYFRN
ncbi:MAG: hypothetical protein ACRDDH_16835 [Cetobacterium sp.]|uniref:hypothetical protein n=1 Tax=Cetobacterium sp. TaxID=2071632 RepID=UPI003EE63DD7